MNQAKSFFIVQNDGRVRLETNTPEQAEELKQDSRIVYAAYFESIDGVDYEYPVPIIGDIFRDDIARLHRQAIDYSQSLVS